MITKPIYFLSGGQSSDQGEGHLIDMDQTIFLSKGELRRDSCTYSTSISSRDPLDDAKRVVER